MFYKYWIRHVFWLGDPGTCRCWEQNTSQIQIMRRFEKGARWYY